uniref:Uncharacterized protein n=1 Tax=Bionectria ochroleuca TaxID=29856 RepID=A0A8H7K9X8_BIOOC
MHPLDRGQGIDVHPVADKHLHDPGASVVNQGSVQQAAPVGIASGCIGTLFEQEPQGALDIGPGMFLWKQAKQRRVASAIPSLEVGAGINDPSEDVFADVTVPVVPRSNQRVQRQTLLFKEVADVRVDALLDQLHRGATLYRSATH